MSDQKLLSSGLQERDIVLASDHLPVVADFDLSGTTDITEEISEKPFEFYKKDGSTFQEFYGSDEAKVTFNTKYIEPIYSGGPLRAGTMEDIGNHIYMGNFQQQNNPPFFIYPSDEYADIDYGWEFQSVESLYLNKP